MSPLIDPARMPPGWYGKLPALGDFASRRLPSDFVQRWDAWLQRGLGRCRDTFGPAWWQRYRVAPVVRFWVPGDDGSGGVARAGLVMPSMDRVGRHFPLTLAAPVASLVLARGAIAWFDALEDAARSVLDLTRSVDDFEATLLALPRPPVAMDGPSAEAPVADAPRVPVDDDVGDDVGDEDEDRPDAGRQGRPGAGGLVRSAWWCADGPPRRFRGWPPPEAFVRVLDATVLDEETLP